MYLQLKVYRFQLIVHLVKIVNKIGFLATKNILRQLKNDFLTK